MRGTSGVPEFNGDQKINSIWNASLTQSGRSVTAQNAGWNSAITADGSVNFGFGANYSGTNTAPSAFALNGKACK